MKLYLYIYLFFIPWVALSKSGIKGRVVDESSHPIVRANVFLPDLKIMETTDSLGYFYIPSLPSGKFLTQISAEGYTDTIIYIDPSKEEICLVVLYHSATELHGVVVTGGGIAVEERKSPIAITSINNKYLWQNMGGNIIDVIAKVPGVSSVNTGPNISKPVIRGLGYSRVLTMVDGIRQDGQQWGDEHGVEIDQYWVDRVEVVKGPASLMYGSDALAGVINMLPANPVSRGSIRGAYLCNFQHNNKQWANSFHVQGNQKYFSWGLRITDKFASNYQNKFDGKVLGTKYHEQDLNAYISLSKKWGNSQLNFSLYDNIQEVPDGYRDSATRKFTKRLGEDDSTRIIVGNQELSSYHIGNLHQHIQHLRIYNTTNFYFGKNKLAIKLGYQQNHRREYSHPLYNDIPGLDLVLGTYTYDIKYIIKPKRVDQLLWGVNGMWQNNQNSAKATNFVIPNYRSFDCGPFIYIKNSYKKFDISGGIRYDVRWLHQQVLYTALDSVTGFTQMNEKSGDILFENVSHFFSGLSASVGSTYNYNKKIGYKVNFSRGYRAPNITEIAAKGVHPGSGFLQIGNIGFKPEFSHQLDAGVLYYGKHITWNIEVFYNHIEHYIYNKKVLNAQGIDSIYIQNGTEYPIFQFQQTRARLYGGEASVDFHPHPYDWLHIENSLSMVYADNLGGNGVKVDADNRYLPFIPPVRTSHEVRAEYKGRWKGLADMYIKINVRYTDSQNRIYVADETTTPAYTLIDVGMGTLFQNRKGKTWAMLNITVSNITNVAYQSNMSRLKYMDNYIQNYTGRSGIYNMGRNFGIKIVIPFETRKYLK